MPNQTKIPLKSENGEAGPVIGVPYRTLNEQLSNTRGPYEKYVAALKQAGAEALEIPLNLTPGELAILANRVDGVLLPGGPADLEPTRYGAPRHPKCAYADPSREATDNTLLRHAFAEHKPVLGICYGLQSLNVYLGGSLVQDIDSEHGTNDRNPIRHEWKDREKNAEPFHAVKVDRDSRLGRIEAEARRAETPVNSSHHQSILEPAKGLKVTAEATDGIIEAVEWNREGDWVTAVQWHPERNMNDPLSAGLFREFVAAARERKAAPLETARR
jgi:putative glutamine amidotransferase